MEAEENAPSPKQFGDQIAADVADLLSRGGRVLWGWNAHWMLKKGDRFVYELLKDSRQEIFASADQQAFAAWLSRQSPRSLHEHARPACGDAVEVVTHDLLAEAVAGNSGINDATPFGAMLAGQLADALDRGVAVTYVHRDYCGMGLVRRPDGYAYGPVYDGDLLDSTVFPTRAAFIAWLAVQSDATLSGRDGPAPFDWDNQRITRARLLDALKAPTPE
jgi:hypothetical protein